jgi:hypothetical protein
MTGPAAGSGQSGHGTSRKSTFFSPILRRIVLTLVPSGITYAVTVFFQQDQIWAITLATFIGGVFLVVQFLSEFDDRLRTVEIEHAGRVHALEEAQRKHAAEIQRLVHEGFNEISEATRLFSLVKESGLRAEVLTQLVQHSAQIGPAPALIFDLAQSEIGRMSDFLREVATGADVTYDGEDREWLLGLTRHARHNINATSLTTVDGGISDGLWSTDLGQRYLDVQREAVRRGVVIRRLFVIDRRELAHAGGLYDVCRLQRELGIHVRVLDPSAMPPLERNRVFDFILFDDAVCYETSTSARIEEANAPVVNSTRLVLAAKRLQTRKAQFGALWDAARDFSG